MDAIRTLIVDDDADQRMLVRSLLDRAGVGPVAEATDAAGALAQASTGPFDLILLDIAMPGTSGLDVLPELALHAPHAAIVVLSNFPRHRLGDTALARGAVGYVEKRVAPDRLVAEILMAAAISTTAAAHATAHLPADPTSPRAARGLVRDLLGTEDAALVGAVELLVTELVTNAILHAESAPRVAVDLARDLIRVAVYDDDATPPRLRVPDLDAPGGRGLRLVDEMASRWGSDSHGAGKVVWFELDRAPSPSR